MGKVDGFKRWEGQVEGMGLAGSLRLFGEGEGGAWGNTCVFGLSS